MPHLIFAIAGMLAALVVGATTDEIIRDVYDSSNTAFRVNIVAGSAGGGTVTGTGTVGLIPDWTSTTALGDSTAYRISVANDGATGTVANQLVKLTSTGTAIRTSVAETAGVLGVCIDGCGTTGNAVVALMGQAPCDFTNATTAGNYATVSATVAGECQDTGSTSFPAAGTVALGIVTETGAAGVRSTFLATPDVASASQGGGGGGNKNPAGAAGDVQYRASNNAFDAEAAFNYNEGTNTLTVDNITLASTEPLRMRTIGAAVESATALADGDDTHACFINMMGAALTLTECCCKVDSTTGTPTVMFQRNDGSAADILAAGLACDTTADGACTTSFSGSENVIANAESVDCLVTTAGGTATQLSMQCVGTVP